MGAGAVPPEGTAVGVFDQRRVIEVGADQLEGAGAGRDWTGQ